MNFNFTPRISAFAIIAPLAILASPAAAQSADEDVEGGVYVTVQAGVTTPSDELFQGVQAPAAGSPGVAGAPAQPLVEYGEGFTGSVALGYQFPTRVLGVIQPSIETEYSYAEADVTGGSFNGGNQTFGGDIETHSFLLNAQADFVFSDDQRVVPFIGGGIGVTDVESFATYFPNNGVATAPTFAVTDGGTGFTYQGNAGLRFDLTDTFSVQGAVRYQNVSGLDFERTFIGGGAEVFNADLEGDYETVSFLAGVRYRF